MLNRRLRVIAPGTLVADRGAHARRATAYYASLRGCAQLAAYPS